MKEDLDVVPNTPSKMISRREAQTVQSIEMGEHGTLLTVNPVIQHFQSESFH